MQRLLFFCYLLIFTTSAFPGTTGTLHGTVRDSLTGKTIPGVSVQIQKTDLRTLTNKNGDFTLSNLPAGSYDLKLDMIGYVPLAIREVQINADSYSHLSASMVSDVLEIAPEIIIIGDQSTLRADVAAGLQSVSGDVLMKELPVQTLAEAIDLQPGCVANHFRGGRSDETKYLVDGLPAQSEFNREYALPLSLNSISEISIYTGGYSAEYGDAISGIANIITSEANDNTEAHFRLASDNVGLTDQFENLNHLEFGLSGPIVLGFGGPIYNFNYLIAGDFFLTDTKFRRTVAQAFSSPVVKNSSLNIKLAFNPNPKMKLSVQSLSFVRDWQTYLYEWRDNLAGLPEYQSQLNRYSVAFSHSITSSSYYTLQIGYLTHSRSISGDQAFQYVPLIRQIDDQFNTPIIDGKMQYREKFDESDIILKAHFACQVNEMNRFKMGFESKPISIAMENSGYEEIPVNGNLSLISYNRVANDIDCRALRGAVYAENRLRFRDIWLNIGVRVEMLNANADRPLQNFAIAPDTISIREKKSRTKHQICPRLGIFFPLTPTDQLLLSYGWYAQTAPLSYFCANLEQSFDGAYLLFGNPGLDFERSIQYEMQYKKMLSQSCDIYVSYFQKEAYNLIGTTAHLVIDPPTESRQIRTPIAYFEYTNRGHATIYGLETQVSIQLHPNLSADASYCYTNASGTGSHAKEMYYRTIWGLNQLDNTEYPLNWDQRHRFILNCNLNQPEKWSLHITGQLGSPLPYSSSYAAEPNQNRLQWHSVWSLKASVHFNSTHIQITPYLNFINIFDNKCIMFAPESGLNENNLIDPSNYLPGRRVLLGIHCNFR
ncbi:TonB-dependent receptor [candidate division KSB1 bacterium]|nr:TonB-dependent receptor [candidate division KSB1 bacterium]